MRSSFRRDRRLSLIASCVAVSSIGVLSAGDALGATTQSGEQRSMVRVGHSDLQGRVAYQPNFIRYPDGRIIAFIGTHNGSRPNPLNGGVVEPNGTMIVDVTDPKTRSTSSTFQCLLREVRRRWRACASAPFCRKVKAAGCT